MMDSFIELVTKVGLPVALVIYFVWRDGKREKATNDRFADLDNFCKHDLKRIAEGAVKVNQQCADALKENKEVITKSNETIEKTQKVLHECKLYLANNSRN